MDQIDGWLTTRHELEKIAYRQIQSDGSLLVKWTFGNSVSIPRSEITNYEEWSKKRPRTTKRTVFLMLLATLAVTLIRKFVGALSGSSAVEFGTILAVILMLVIAYIIIERRKALSFFKAIPGAQISNVEKGKFKGRWSLIGCASPVANPWWLVFWALFGIFVLWEGLNIHLAAGTNLLHLAGPMLFLATMFFVAPGLIAFNRMKFFNRHGQRLTPEALFELWGDNKI